MEILKSDACPNKIDTYKHLKRSIRILLCSPNPTTSVVFIYNHKDKHLQKFIHDIVAVN